MKRELAYMLATLALLLAIVGCRGRQADPDAAPPAPPAAATDSPHALAQRARSAMEQARFDDAGELFCQAAETPDPDGLVSEQQRFDWRCRSMLCHWLGAGGADLARRVFRLDIDNPFADSAITGRADIESSRKDYAVALWRAMALYEECRRGPLPDDKIVVLDMAAALQAGPIPDGPAASDARLSADWAELARLPRALAAWSAMDAGGLNLGDYQIAVLMSLDEPPASGPDDWLPPDTIRCGRMIQPTLAPADQSRTVEDWLTWFGRRAGLPPNRATLRISVRRHPQVVARVEAKVSWAGGRARVEYVQCPTKAQADRLAAGLRILASAMPDGATALASREQAELLVATLAGFTGQAAAASVQPQDNFFWVIPAKGQGGQLIPLVAGWLAGRGWQAPADEPTTQAQTEQDGDVPGPGEP